MPAVTPTQLRTDFPEFSDTALYADSLLTFWLAVAEKLVNAGRWGDLTSLGIELFAAHNLALEARAKLDAVFGKIPGMTQGIMSSKSVDKVSAGYDTSSAIEPDAGHWNLTVYGTRYIRLARMMGAGPIQIGLPTADTPVYGGAWPGVIY